MVKICKLFVKAILPPYCYVYPEGTPSVFHHSYGLVVFHLELHCRWMESGMELHLHRVSILPQCFLALQRFYIKLPSILVDSLLIHHCCLIANNQTEHHSLVQMLNLFSQRLRVFLLDQFP